VAFATEHRILLLEPQEEVTRLRPCPRSTLPPHSSVLCPKFPLNALTELLWKLAEQHLTSRSGAELCCLLHAGTATPDTTEDK